MDSMNNSLASSTSSYKSASEVPQTADGTFVIIVCRAKHLPNRRKLDKQSPYVTLRVGTIAKKTPSHFRAGQTPDWTHEVRFELTRDRKPLLKLDVLDETKNDPTPIGTCDIDCSVIFQDENHKDGKYIYDKWYDLSLNGRRAGMIYLEMTFYPSAPVLPPKMYESEAMDQSARSSGYGSSFSAKELPPPPTPPPAKAPSVVDDVFVSGEEKKRFGMSVSGSARSLSAKPENSDVFVSTPPQDRKHKYLDKLNKFKTKFQTKEPITTLWNHEPSRQERAAKLSPIDLKEFDKELDELQRDLQFTSPPQFSSSAHDSNRPLTSMSKDIEDEEISFESPPSPPAHSEASMNMFPRSVEYGAAPEQRSPGLSPPSKVSRARDAKSKSPLRKPPPNVSSPTTSIPYSADAIGLDDEDLTAASGLPTKVYFMDQQVKSLSHSSSPNPPNPVNKDEIDPRYYAPTPNEHFGSSKRERRPLDIRNNDTGYLGNGHWETKFSPSIFDRISGNNDENAGFENKPHVPPKIPRGMTEQEYYVLEKEKYMRDINGQRL